MSGGIRNRAINSAFNPPPAQPTSRAISAAAGKGKCQSRQAAPKTTAARPSIDPTERSLPPDTITGVSAIANSPNSTLKRSASKKLPAVKKFRPMAENSPTSAASASSRIHSPFGNQRSRRLLCAECGRASRMSLRILSRARADRVDGHRHQNNYALYGSLPIGADPEKRQSRADDSEQNQTEQSAQDSPFATCDDSAADHHRGNRLQLQTQPRVAGNLVEADRIQQGRKAGEGSGNDKHGEGDQGRMNARQPGGVPIGAGGVYRAAGRQVSQGPGHARQQQHGARERYGLAGGLRETEPLEIGRQVLHPCALSLPAKPIAQRYHGGERYDDGGDSHVSHEGAIERTKGRAEGAGGYGSHRRRQPH